MAFFVVAIIGFVFVGGSDDGSLSLLSLISLFSDLSRLVLRSSLSVATSSTVASSSMESKRLLCHLSYIGISSLPAKTQLIKAREQQQQQQKRQGKFCMVLLVRYLHKFQGRSQQLPGSTLDIKSEINPVLNPRAAGPEGSLIGMPGSNQGSNNLTLKGWPLTISC
ncbi:uncharacterized protein [Arachis hypogaea]|uniref:uncharacterized protein n=1 Tax=Arachis hypogaea TaxID=3818 RepID=UPI003B21F341